MAPDVVAGRVAAAARTLEGLGIPSFRHVSVTDVAKGGRDLQEVPAPTTEPHAPGTGRFRGYSWGSAVHGALAAASDDDAEVPLRAACRSLLVEHGRPLDDHGEPAELEELLALVASVRASELWRRARHARRTLVEVPLAATDVPRSAPGGDAGPDEGGPAPGSAAKGRSGARKQLDLFALQTEEAAASAPSQPAAVQPVRPIEVLEGVIDLAFQEDDGWVIADYKTDVGTDPEFPARVVAYRRQVELYACAWTHVTGEPVKERVLFFTAQDRLESW